MLYALLVLMQAGAPAPAPAAARPDIVVTGVKLSMLKADLDRCVAEKCPPRADIIASVRYAEGLFRTGSYVEAKRVLTRSVGRNKGAARADPLAVSELYLAQATVAQHEGDQDMMRKASFRRVEVLRGAMPADSPGLLMAEMSIGDLEMRNGDVWAAKRQFDELARRSGGDPAITAAVALRRANIASGNGRYGEAQRLLEPVMALTDPALTGYRLAARVLSARVARDRGDRRAIDRVLNEIAGENRQAAPLLLWSKPPRVPTDPAGLDAFQRVDAVSRSGEIFTLGWIDVGFWVKPDGRVENVEILRGSNNRAWTPPVLESVETRIYARIKDTAAGQYRVERFTLTADYGVPLKSLIRRRGFNPRIERLDITAGAVPPTHDGGNGTSSPA